MFTDEDLKQAINAGIFSATNDVTATPAAVIRFFEKWAKERICVENEILLNAAIEAVELIAVEDAKYQALNVLQIALEKCTTPST